MIKPQQYRSMNMIFHHTSPIDPNASVGSSVRPLQMIKAFEALGYSIDFATGFIQERKKRMQEIKKKIKAGKQYDFVYAENSNLPNSVSPTERTPVHFLMDYSFFKACNKYDIPIGLFYRDIFWAFGKFGKTQNRALQTLVKMLYKLDLQFYNKTLTKFYLPSLTMAQYVPIISRHLVDALPPGGSTTDINIGLKNTPNERLKLCYVGGFGDHYKMHVLFEAVNCCPEIELILCTRKREWELAKHEYPILGDNIKIVHLFGLEMEQMLIECDIALIFVEPAPYWTATYPIKLFEYMGVLKPIIASSGTLASEFVREHNVGWVVEYTKEALINLFNELITYPTKVEVAISHIKNIKDQHTWPMRAQKVVNDLNGLQDINRN